VKFDKLEPGMIAYDVGRYRMGNTTITTVGVWKVHVLSVDPETRSCEASWNGNPSRRFYESKFSKWRAAEPLLVEGSFGSRRLATRAEIAAHKAKEPK
jgi:hypothetical protein